MDRCVVSSFALSVGAFVPIFLTGDQSCRAVKACIPSPIRPLCRIVSYRVALLLLCVAITSPTTITCALISLPPPLLSVPPHCLSLHPNAVSRPAPSLPPGTRSPARTPSSLLTACWASAPALALALAAQEGRTASVSSSQVGALPLSAPSYPNFAKPPMRLVASSLACIPRRSILNSPLSPLHSHSSVSSSISRRTDGSVLLSSPPLTQRTHRMRFTLNPRCT